jgi:hypothetical protein
MNNSRYCYSDYFSSKSRHNLNSGYFIMINENGPSISYSFIGLSKFGFNNIIMMVNV